MEKIRSLIEQKNLGNPITIFIISLVLTYIISIFHWLGIIVGPMIGGLLIIDYKKSIIINGAAGFLAWSLLFTQNIVIVGEPVVKAYAITGSYFIIAIIIGIILAILSGIVGTAIINIVREAEKTGGSKEGEESGKKKE
ncbi:MAG: hypothetical protein ACP6IP_00875 [Candidatus Njordarchaeia archaeon]